MTRIFSSVIENKVASHYRTSKPAYRCLALFSALQINIDIGPYYSVTLIKVILVTNARSVSVTHRVTNGEVVNREHAVILLK